ncbi:MAG: ammonium transporter [Planctomycetaceae bacterium]|nr:ammonium transporter [Planctomycetaceae bacterium]
MSGAVLYAQDTEEPAVAAPAAAPVEDPLQKSITELTTNYASLKVTADTMWVMITAMLVFFMNLGFACVESGMCRAKNCVNILSKNFIVFAVTSIAFWFMGWGLMFGDGSDNGLIGENGVFMVKGADNSPALWNAEAALNKYEGVYSGIGWTGTPLWAKFFFQLVFAGTAATIVSGAVAERIKYQTFIVFSVFMAIVIYPVVGHWIWGGGWLAAKFNFLDFAGSTQVHSIGGWAALMGILFLGPRIGKYAPDGKVNAIPGHNMTAATIGCFVLWLGWFGFNPGSTMAADASFIADVAVVTNAGAAAATLTATITSWLLLGKPDIGMTLNGCLAGLVAVTAPCAWISIESGMIIGAIAGALVVFAVIGFDKLKIDDPVGATSVHLVNGVFGTLCVGLFADPAIMASRALDPTKFKGGLFFGGGMDQLIAQLIGIVATAGYVVVVSAIVWAILKATMGMRVSKAEEIEGLDIGEHGNEAYHGFVIQEG